MGKHTLFIQKAFGPSTFSKKSLHSVTLSSKYLQPTWLLLQHILQSQNKNFLQNIIPRNEQTNAEFPIRKLWFSLHFQTNSLLPFIVYLHSYSAVILALNVSLPTSQVVQYCFPHLLQAWI